MWKKLFLSGIMEKTMGICTSRTAWTWAAAGGMERSLTGRTLAVACRMREGQPCRAEKKRRGRKTMILSMTVRNCVRMAVCQAVMGRGEAEKVWVWEAVMWPLSIQMMNMTVTKIFLKMQKRLLLMPVKTV